jgi:hypothetical protein
MILQINFKSGMPIYLQVVDQIKAADGRFHFCIRDSEIRSLLNAPPPCQGDTVHLAFGF